MKIKCINNSDKLQITINKSYVVFGGEFSENNCIKTYTSFKIEDDYGSIIPYEAKKFEVVNENIKNYIINKVSDNTFEFDYKYISYWDFWSMLYDEAGTSINDFNRAKQELFRNELSEEEIIEKIYDEKLDERDFIINLLTIDKNDKFIPIVISFCRNHLNQWKNPSELENMFLYLSKFKAESVSQFFIDYMIDNEKGTKSIDLIVDNYFDN